MHIFYKHVKQILNDLDLYAKRCEKTTKVEDRLKFERAMHSLFVDLHAIFIKRIRKHEIKIQEEGLDLLDDRERDIYLQRKSGVELGELSKKYHFSRERVLQIEKRAQSIMNKFYKLKQSGSIIIPKIEELDLCIRTYNALINAGINTTDDLLNTPISELKTIKNMDHEAFINELKSMLALYGLQLKN